jgi:phage terminase small subunit
MAGVKGKSGGARPNSGGKRQGAGRKPKTPAAKSANSGKRAVPPPTALPAELDMLRLLQAVALGYVEASTTQVRAAIAAVQYTHAKKGEVSKKAEAESARVKAAGGSKYGVRRGPPALKVVGG